MLSLQLSEFVVELKEGSIKNVGPPNKTATAKIYDVVDAEAREFGDERVKIAVEDEEGNVVQVALDPEAASQVARDIEALEADSRVFDEE
jgi:type II secretory pathway component PulM